ncbi:hypothetical protein FYJ53_15830 [Eubacterium sp. BL-380-WT-2B]|nr:hypothetical protein [Eubacterium sp. BL-380-WT-2B]
MKNVCIYIIELLFSFCNKKIKLPIQKTESSKKVKVSWESNLYFKKVRGMCVQNYLYHCEVDFKQ